MSRCQYCPSSQLRPVHFRPIDYALILLAVRRYRCEFCQELQRRWLVPRPARWVMGMILVGVLYVASAGPVDWLHASGRLSNAGYRRLERWVYPPVQWFSEREGAETCTVTQAYLRYRSWWTADFDHMQPHSVAKPPGPLTRLDERMERSR